MGDLNNISKALKKVITDAGTVTDGRLYYETYPVTFDAVGLTPKGNQKFINIYNLPSSAEVAELGATGTQNYQGVYQIDVAIPRGAGADSAYSTLDDLRVLYSIGGSSTFNDVTINFINQTIIPLRNSGAFAILGLNVVYDTNLVRA